MPTPSTADTHSSEHTARVTSPISGIALRPDPYRHLDDEAVYRGIERLSERGDPATLALSWVISNPAVSAAVVGPRRPAHLEPALAAPGLSMSAGERDEIAALFS